MNRVQVNSSNLYSVGYDPFSLTLEVEFMRGDVYQYLRVPAGVHNGLLSASSKGSYFAQVIRDTYSYALVA